MARRINLHTTHRLLFFQSLIVGIMALINGLGILLYPEFFFGSYNVIKDVAITPIWGTLWLLGAVSTLLGLFKLKYLFVRVGMGVIGTLLFTWSVGIFMNQVFHTPPYALLAVGVYAGFSGLVLSTLLEPPINPETAVSTKPRSER